MVTSYYNEIDKFAAQWLRNLIRDGLIPEGDVDERSIIDVRGGDLRGYEQCHFFAGIGGWPYALQLAGWTGPVWTGSAPCQPFSAAGKQSGAADERHLWPAWFALIRECRPEYIFGEQVSSAIRLGWLDGVFTDLELEGYTTGAAVLGAHSVGAPHIRQRLYWVADAQSAERERGGGAWQRRQGFADHGGAHGLALPNSDECTESVPGGAREAQGVPEEHRAGITSAGWPGRTGGALPERLGDTDDTGSQGRQFGGDCASERTAWSPSVVIECGDGKSRRIPVEPAFFPLVDGPSTGRVGILRGAGNAIVPPVAAEFVAAFMEANHESGK